MAESNISKLCSVDGCPHKARHKYGHCQTHWRRMKRTGQLEKIPRISKKSLPCTIEGCEKLQDALGWCPMHYARFKSNGNPLVKQLRSRRPCSVDGCSSLNSSGGMCMKHSRRFKKYGDPLKTFNNSQRPHAVERFLKYVTATATCWLWTGHINPGGYGVFNINGKRVHASRASFYLHHGRWPEPMCLHSCDNRQCVNPAHLSEGTAGDNAKDRVIHGNLKFAKLTRDDVKRIKQMLRDGMAQKDIASMFGVHQGTVSAIKCGVSWKYIG